MNKTDSNCISATATAAAATSVAEVSPLTLPPSTLLLSSHPPPQPPSSPPSTPSSGLETEADEEEESIEGCKTATHSLASTRDRILELFMDKHQVPSPGEWLAILGLQVEKSQDKKWFKYLNEGLKAIENSDISYAEVRLKLAVSNCESTKMDVETVCCCIAALGYFYVTTEQFGKACEEYNSALTKFTAKYKQDGSRSVIFYGTLATATAFAHRPSEAKDLFSKALQISQACNGKDHEISIYLMERVADCLSEMGRFDDADALYASVLQALDSNLSLSARSSTAAHYSSHEDTGKPPASTVQISLVVCMYEKARNLQKKRFSMISGDANNSNNDDEDIDSAWIDKLVLLYNSHRKAARALAQLATHQRAIGFSFYASILYERALLLLDHNRKMKASACYDASRIHCNLAETYRDLKQYRQSLAHFDRALDVLQALQAADDEKIGIYAEKARVLHEMDPDHNAAQAHSLFHHAFTLLDSCKATPNAIVVLRLFAEYLKRAGHPQQLQQQQQPPREDAPSYQALEKRASALEHQFGFKLQL